MPSSAISAQGTIVQIGTGTGGAKTITAVSTTNPVVVTSSAHGLSNGDRVTIASIVGSMGTSLLNGNTYTVMYKTTNTFALAADGTGLTYTSGGTATPVTYTAIANVRTVQGFDGAAAEIDVTNLASTAKEKRLGLVDNGQLQLGIHQDNGDGGQQALRTKQASGAVSDFKLILPSGSTPTASFQGYVKSFSTSVGVDSVVDASVSITLSGAVTWS